MSNNPQDHLINFALKELNKVLHDLKTGKSPEMSEPMHKMAIELEKVNDKRKNMSDEEIKNFAEKLIKEISALDDGE